MTAPITLFILRDIETLLTPAIHAAIEAQGTEPETFAALFNFQAGNGDRDLEQAAYLVSRLAWQFITGHLLQVRFRAGSEILSPNITPSFWPLAILETALFWKGTEKPFNDWQPVAPTPPSLTQANCRAAQELIAANPTSDLDDDQIPFDDVDDRDAKVTKGD